MREEVCLCLSPIEDGDTKTGTGTREDLGEVLAREQTPTVTLHPTLPGRLDARRKPGGKKGTRPGLAVVLAGLSVPGPME